MSEQKPTFKELMKLMDPDVILEKVFLPNDHARITFHINKNTVSTYEEYKEAIIDYYNHHYMAVIAPVKPPVESTLRHLEKILAGAFGSFVNSYTMATTGCDGGLHQIFNKIAESFRDDQEESYTNYIIRKIEPTDTNYIFSLMSEFLGKHSQYASNQGRGISPWMLVTNYSEVIKAHVREVGNAQKTARFYGYAG